MAATKINLNGVSEIDLTLGGTTSASLSSPGVVSVTNIPPSATPSTPGLIQLSGDLGGTATSPEVTSTHLSAPLPVAQGGTGAATAPAALTSLGAAPLASPSFTGTPTINGATPALLDSSSTQNFKSPASGQAGMSVERKVSTDTAQMLGVVNETNTGWLASMNADGSITGAFLQLTPSSTATSASSGSASALPAAPAGYLAISINGTNYKLPFFNT